MKSPSEGRQAYDAIAEELISPYTVMADLDQQGVELAREYAKRTKQRWPPRPRTTGWQLRISSSGPAEGNNPVSGIAYSE